MSATPSPLAAWIDALALPLETADDGPLDFELLSALVACGHPSVEAWIAGAPPVSKSQLWATLADERSARGDAPGAAATVAHAGDAALASRHPLPAIDLLRRWGPSAVPSVRAYVESFTRRPGEWFLGAHAVLADALASDDPAAADRHLATALRPPPPFSPDIRKHASALEAVVLAACLAHRLSVLGRAEEAAAPRDIALDRFTRGLGTDYEDRLARFDLAEEEGIAELAPVCRALFALLFLAFPAEEPAPLRVAGDGLLAEALAAAGRYEEARALSAEGDTTLVCAAIASGARDPRERDAALAAALAAGSREELFARYDEGLLTEGERDAAFCALGRALGRCGRREEGLVFLGSVVDGARDAWQGALPRVRDAVKAGLRGEVVVPSALFDPVSDRALATARKSSRSLLVWRLVRAASSRPGPAGAAVLDEALALAGSMTNGDSWLGACAVHGRLDAARPLADLAYAQLATWPQAHVPLDELTAFIVALVAAGRGDEAARELARWLPLPPDLRLLPAVLAVASRQGALPALAERMAAALTRRDARADACRL